jgi:hypothetical protein
MNITNPILEDAIALALDAHRGQVDRAGSPYILYPLRVMARMSTDAERIAAILHDSVEDSGGRVTFERIAALGVPPDQIPSHLSPAAGRRRTPYPLTPPSVSPAAM